MAYIISQSNSEFQQDKHLDNKPVPINDTQALMDVWQASETSFKNSRPTLVVCQLINEITDWVWKLYALPLCVYVEGLANLVTYI